MPQSPDFYGILCNKILDLCDASAVGVSTFCRETNELEVRYVAVRGGSDAAPPRPSGRRLVGLRVPVSEATYREMMARVVRTTEDLSELTVGAIPSRVSAAIRSEFGLGQFTGLALQHDGRLLGTVVIARRAGEPLLPGSLSSTLAGIVTVALQSRITFDELLASEERLRSFVAHSLDAVLLTDAAGRIVGANPAACRMFGYAEEELRRLGHAWIADFGGPALQNALEERNRTGHFQRELTLTRRDGSRFVASVASSVYRGPGGGLQSSTIIRDITESHLLHEATVASERRYRGLVDSSLVGVFQATRRGRLVFANEALARMFGCSTPQELLALPSERLYKNSQDREDLLRRLTTGGQFSEYEFEIVTLQGEVKRILSSASLTDDLISGTAIDITERSRIETELRGAKQRLEQLSHRLIEAQEAERSAVARELHDEVGQVLTMAKIDLQLTRRAASGVAEVTARLDENIRILDRCLAQVRDLSLDLRPAMLDDLGLAVTLQWQLDRYVQRGAFAAQLSGDAIPATISPQLSISCYRIAHEALTNIARHAEAKNVQVEFRIRGSWLEMTIRDDGVGFDVELASKDSARGKSCGITGMQERAALLGGRLEVISQQGAGASIVARLPLTASVRP